MSGTALASLSGLERNLKEHTYYDGHGIENLQIAAHEVDHFFNNLNNRKGYFIFKNHSTIFLVSLMLVHYVMAQLPNGARPWIFLVLLWAISLVLAILAFLIKVKDEAKLIESS